MGISIDQVQLKNIKPPEPVQKSFNEVNQQADPHRRSGFTSLGSRFRADSSPSGMNTSDESRSTTDCRE